MDKNWLLKTIARDRPMNPEARARILEHLHDGGFLEDDVTEAWALYEALAPVYYTVINDLQARIVMAHCSGSVGVARAEASIDARLIGAPALRAFVLGWHSRVGGQTRDGISAREDSHGGVRLAIDGVKPAGAGYVTIFVSLENTSTIGPAIVFKHEQDRELRHLVTMLVDSEVSIHDARVGLIGA